MVDSSQIIERFKELTGVKKDKDIAVLLGIAATNFNNRKKRGTLRPLIVDWAIREGYNPAWLTTGKGEKRTGQISGLSMDLVEQVIEQLGRYQTSEQPNSPDLELLNRLYPLLNPEQQKTLLVQAAGWALAKLDS